MDFIETYYRLYLAEILEYQEIDKAKLAHDNRNKHILKQCINQKAAEKIRYEIEKRTKDDLKRKLKVRSVINKLST